MVAILLANLLFLIPGTAVSSKERNSHQYSSQIALAVPSPITLLNAPQSIERGSCASEVVKYDWNHKVALSVTKAESGANPTKVNNNPKTRDYSVGCFQINIFQKLAKNRPSEKELKKAHVNVAFAYKMWKSEGWSPWSVCRGKVRCY